MDLEGLTKELQAALPLPTKVAAQLPGPSDLSFHRALDRSLHRSLGDQSQRVLSLAQRTLNYLQQSYDAPERAELDGDMILEGEYKIVADSLERVLERADEALEYAAGLKKAPAVTTTQEQPVTPSRRLEKSLYLADIDKPQERFLRYDKPPRLPPYGQDEDHDRPLWIPSHVPNKRLKTRQTQQNLPPRNTPFGRPYMAYAHPYEQEINTFDLPIRLLVAPPPLSSDDAEDPQEIVRMDERFEDTPYAWVDSLDGLNSMIDEIRQSGERHAKDLAIDVEHHDKRTWQGLTSLIQLSTYDKDYVVDVLAPEVRENAHLLNEFTTSKDWIKVLHGAQRDIIWLQRDLGIYVVGLFDTYFATHALNLAQHSLASLLDAYTSFVADKKYQQADWRIRPLPIEMAHYARSDTHFLLHIFNSLLRAIHKAKDGYSATERLREIWSKSRETSAKVHTRAPFTIDPESNVDILSLIDRLERELPSSFLSTDDQARESMIEKIKRLAYVRENVARQADDSTAFIMPFKAFRALFESLGKIETALDVRETLARVNASKTTLGHEEEILDALKAEPSTGGDTTAAPSSASLSNLWTTANTTARASTSDLFDSAASTSSSDVFKNLRAPSSSLFSTSISSTRKAQGKRKAEVLSMPTTKEKSRQESVQKVQETLLLGGALSNHVSGISAVQTGDTSLKRETEEEKDGADVMQVEPHQDTNHTFVPPIASTSKTNTFSSASEDSRTKDTDHKTVRDEQVKRENEDEPVVVSELSKSQRKKNNRKKRQRVEEESTASTVTLDTEAKEKKKKKVKKERPEVVPFDPKAQPSILDARPSSTPKPPVTAPPSQNQSQAQGQTVTSKSKKQHPSKKSGKEEKTSDGSDFKRIRVPNFEKKGSKSKTFA